MDDLKAENEMSVEELRQKYSGLPTPSVMDENSSEGTEESLEKTEESSENESISEVDMDTEEDESQESEVGLKSLLDDDSQVEGEDTKTDKNNDLINDAAAIAESIQPKGNTLSSTSVSGF